MVEPAGAAPTSSVGEAKLILSPEHPVSLPTVGGNFPGICRDWVGLFSQKPAKVGKVHRSRCFPWGPRSHPAWAPVQERKPALSTELCLLFFAWISANRGTISTENLAKPPWRAPLQRFPTQRAPPRVFPYQELPESLEFHSTHGLCKPRATSDVPAVFWLTSSIPGCACALSSEDRVPVLG